MSQNDYSIDNADGATVRADMNNAFQAGASNNAGTAEPSTTYAYQAWQDTTNNQYKLRNSANNAWNILFHYDGATGIMFNQRKGADIASAGALTIGKDGNAFDITGTTSITSISTSGVIGTMVTLQFDGALTLTHHATDLILPGATNIVTAAGDEAIFIEYASGDWRCVIYKRASDSPQENRLNAIGSIGGGTQDIDLKLGRSVTATVDTSTTTFTFSNPKASGIYDCFDMVLTNAGSQTLNFPASVRWAGGSAPEFTASGVDKLFFETTDGGTTWDGYYSLDRS